MSKELVMPMQPIVDGRFVENRMVSTLLNSKENLTLNDLAVMDFTQQERMQFAQLIGYSVEGFGSLSYVDNETYEAALSLASTDLNELEARCKVIRYELKSIKEHLKQAAVIAFNMHPDDFD